MAPFAVCLRLGLRGRLLGVDTPCAIQRLTDCRRKVAKQCLALVAVPFLGRLGWVLLSPVPNVARAVMPVGCRVIASECEVPPYSLRL